MKGFVVLIFAGFPVCTRLNKKYSVTENRVQNGYEAEDKRRERYEEVEEKQCNMRKQLKKLTSPLRHRNRQIGLHHPLPACRNGGRARTVYIVTCCKSAAARRGLGGGG